MIFTTVISLFTSRVILQSLGVEDFGIYNVVGGVVTMLSFVNSSLSSASSRFITFSLGSNDKNEIQKTFDSIVTMHYSFAALILVFAETIGLWFVMNKLTIPIDRMHATMWVYQCAILAAVISFISTPYNALIIAHEKMKAFAYVTIYEKTAQLAIAYVLFISPIDKLILYALLLVSVQISVRVIYTLYCKKNFEESHYKLSMDLTRLKSVFSYAGWVFNGNLAFLGYTQGLNILLNMYFGPVVNAARGLSVQVQSSILHFTQSYQTAVNPQIIKSYASSDFDRMHKLVLLSSKFGFYLMLLLTIPIFFNIDYILSLWLKEVPEHTGNFVYIMLILGLNSTLRNPTITAIHATGDLKKFQLWEGSLLLSIIPIAWLLLKLFSINPEQVLCVYLFVELFTQFVRVIIVYKKINLMRKLYFTKVLTPCIIVSTSIVLVNLFIFRCFSILSISVFMLYVIINSLVLIFIIYAVGINKDERKMIKDFVNKMFKKYVRH